MDAITERIATTVTLLRGTAGLFIATGDVSREEFRAYIGRLRLRELYPGIQGIGYTARVDAPNVAGHEAVMQQVWGPWFRLWPTAEEVPRELLTSISYLEPLDERNYAAIGYDMASGWRRTSCIQSTTSSISMA